MSVEDETQATSTDAQVIDGTTVAPDATVEGSKDARIAALQREVQAQLDKVARGQEAMLALRDESSEQKRRQRRALGAERLGRCLRRARRQQLARGLSQWRAAAALALYARAAHRARRTRRAGGLPKVGGPLHRRASAWPSLRLGECRTAVLPVPVWAIPSRSRPSSNGGMACAWMGVGSSYPCSRMARRIGSSRPHEGHVGWPGSNQAARAQPVRSQ